MKTLLVTSLLLLVCYSELVQSVCQDERLTCAYMKEFCWFSSFAYWCKKTCGLCDGSKTTTPTPATTTTTTTTTASRAPPLPKTTETPQLPSCGRPQIQGARVIGGSDAKPNTWPWQILLVKQGYPSCGGAIINSEWIVTAAHCIDTRLSYSDYFIRTGDHDLNRMEYTEDDYDVKKIIVHPAWNANTIQNDIALIKVKTSIRFNKYTSPVCLPQADTPVGNDCVITGWGKIDHPGSMHSILQQAKMPVVSNSVCDSYNRPYTGVRITSGMVCAGHGGKTSVSGCHGDSGGPFVCNNGGVWELHGAVSHGSGDCDADKTYSVFTRIHYYKKWINDSMYYN